MAEASLRRAPHRGGQQRLARRALARGDRRRCSRCEDWRSWLSIALDWGARVRGDGAGGACWPNPLTVVAALFVIGARQLGCAVLMHEAAHRTLFANRRVNDWVGQLAVRLSGVERPLRLPALSPPAPRAHRHRARPRPRPDPAVPDHAREPAPQGVARPLRADRREVRARRVRSGRFARAGATRRRAARRSAWPSTNARAARACSPRSATPSSTCSGPAPGSPPTRS